MQLLKLQLNSRLVESTSKQWSVCLDKHSTCGRSTLDHALLAKADSLNRLVKRVSKRMNLLLVNTFTSGVLTTTNMIESTKQCSFMICFDKQNIHEHSAHCMAVF